MLKKKKFGFLGDFKGIMKVNFIRRASQAPKTLSKYIKSDMMSLKEKFGF